MFKRIVVALDRSEAAGEAFAVALALAQAERAELGICSVVDPVMISGTAPPSPAMDIVIRDMEVDARRIVSEAIDRARRAGVVVAGETRNGAPAFEVLGYAKRFKADLIVMGTHGRRGLQHFFLGSVAEMVLREAAIPVLIVRARASTSKAA